MNFDTNGYNGSKLAGKEKACGRKIDYKSKEKVMKVGEQLEKKWNKKFDGYNCYWCNGYHIGRSWVN